MKTQNRKLKHFTGVLTAVVIALTIFCPRQLAARAARDAERKAKR